MRVRLASAAVAVAVAADVVETEPNSVPLTPKLTVIVPLPLAPMPFAPEASELDSHAS